MIDAVEWQKNNEAYLAAAFNWLRLRLEALAPPSTVIIQNEQPPVVAGKAAEESHWRIFRWSKTDIEMPKSIAQIGASLSEGEVFRVQIEAAAATMDEMAKAEPPPAIIILSERL